ncbi:MAG: PLDc N-terminal domain-containing protein [Bacteroidetes bacterium]|nr:PLDc N-terminal domain-containing protein [Bacteroidota bacterium]MBU1372220.1 PLDc N-terminal domain-containing protein [Bacteroidota bacterium]MBU1484471.1 PLDc N-terminal domain-containing protein [Bacteroidota bacterium]MBU1760518.1 PLDc N-terminal domain-containing protein [Bacteroidota bacterium]MBU2045403.1 PLDc N-terminal domain-containing protein [Bacteroidota bacterium]
MSKIVLMGLFLFPLLVSLLAIKDVFENETLDKSKKIIWIIIVVLIPLIGAIIYFFFGKPKRL